LLDQKRSEQIIQELYERHKPKEINLIHSIGIDKFEPDGKPHIDEDRDGIDDEIYATNVTTFMNVTEPLIEIASQEEIKLALYAIGSISDTFNVPYWQSFTKAKDLVRNYMKSHAGPNIKGRTDQCKFDT
jgi:hypothetical protein